MAGGRVWLSRVTRLAPRKREAVVIPARPDPTRPVKCLAGTWYVIVPRISTRVEGRRLLAGVPGATRPSRLHLDVPEATRSRRHRWYHPHLLPGTNSEGRHRKTVAIIGVAP